MIRAALLGLLACLTLISTSCTENDKEGFKTTTKESVKEAVQIVEPPFDTSLPGAEGLENTIRAYNLSMRNALLDDRYLKMLRKYATEKEVQRVYIDIEFDTLKNVAMRSWQRELAFDNVSASDSSASVDTSETWEFDYVDLKTKEVTEPMKKFKYKLQYSLEKEDGKWVVSKIRELEPSVLTETVELKIKK